MLEGKFLSFIDSNKLINPSDRILIAVSGGLDSIVLTDLIIAAGFNSAIAHCNFGLRGNESDKDEEFVESVAAKYKVPFFVSYPQTEKISQEKKITIQEAAREFRYRWFKDLAEEHDFNCIATGHHLDDSIETFFINLFRNSGPAGLRGIPLKNEMIVRPLLFATRQEIQDYAKEKNLQFREDSSNLTDAYFRNRLRHHLIPLLHEQIPGFHNVMVENFSLFSDVYNALSEFTEEWKKKHVATDENGVIRLPLQIIKQAAHPDALLSAILYSLGITGMDCKMILKNNSPGKIFNSQKYTLLRDRHKLLIQPLIKISPDGPVIINSLPSEIIFFGKKINFKLAENPETPLNDVGIQMLDAGKLLFPLTLRTWKEGDYFYPLGMKGKKKISDFYTDKKIDLFEKEKILLLLSGNDIVCILGHRIDERYKIASNTKKVLIIEL
jgi:tRNA(Ile)-lysidine synthase